MGKNALLVNTCRSDLVAVRRGEQVALQPLRHQRQLLRLVPRHVLQQQYVHHRARS
jgi:hypothetical protein